MIILLRWIIHAKWFEKEKIVESDFLNCSN